MVQANPLDGRTVVWAVPSDRGTGEPIVQPWTERVIEALRATGARIEVFAVPAGGPAPDLTTALGRADVVLATSMAIGDTLAAAGVDRFRLWTFLQGAPGRALLVTDSVVRAVRDTVAHSRKVVVFDEEARSAVEIAVREAAGQVVLLPVNAVDPPAGFRAGAEGPAALVVNLDLTESLGLEAIQRHAERLRPFREVPPVFLVCGPEVLAELRVHPVYRQFAAIPGARAVAPDDDALATALAGTWPVGFVPRPTQDEGYRTAQARIWFEERGIGLFAQVGALPALPRYAGTPRWTPGTFTEDLRTAGCTTEDDAAVCNAGGNTTDSAPARTLADELGEVLGAYLADYGAVPRRPEPTRLLLVGADFKFVGDLVEALAQREDVELRVDLWETNGGPIPRDDRGMLEWADVVLCEYASRNAVWYSQRVRPGQRLLLHLHGYELRQLPIHDIRIDAVETVVFASEFYRQKALEVTGWPPEKTSVIANPVNTVDLARTKLDDARFHLGLAGYVPELKRPDRALDLLEHLLGHDDRYVLHLRGHNPWNYPFVWNVPLRRDAYLAFYERLQRDERLRQAVVFDPFGPDMGNWFRGIGWILSPSTRETFHLAPVEGMASGAVPLVWRREGSEEIFPFRWNVNSAREAADLVLAASADSSRLERHALEAAAFATRYDSRTVTARWLEVLLHAGEGIRTGSTAAVPGTTGLLETGPGAGQQAWRDPWPEAAALVAEGRLAVAGGLLDLDAVRPWELQPAQRRFVAQVIGVPALRQRVHRLHAAPAGAPLRDGRRALLVCGPGQDGQNATGSFGDRLLSLLRLDAGLDDANAVFDQWVDAISRQALASGAGALYAVGDELTALACTVAASRLGLATTWDLDAVPSCAASVLAAAADPDRADDRGVLALMAARHTDRTPGLDHDAVRHRAPVEDRVCRPRLVRTARVGLIGRELSLDGAGRALEAVSLDPGSASARIRSGLDALLVSGRAARQADWNEVVSGPDTVLDRIISEARQYNIPIGFWDSGSAELEPVLGYARRVDAVLAPGAEDVARLHDRRIVPTQVATALPAAQPDGVTTGAVTCLLTEGEQLDLLLRMLRLNA